MSFPKAKLQRFNEIQKSTPSPADYNVATKNHVSGAVIAKSERFTDLRSPVSSDSSFISNGPPATFKTPNPPRKLKPSSNVRKTKPVDLFQVNDDVEALKEKIVECSNKDAFIQELTDLVEELKQELSDLQNVISRLKVDNSDYEINMEKLNEDHENTLRELEAKHELETNTLKAKILEVNEIINMMKQMHHELKTENEEDLSNLLKSIDTLKELMDILSKQFQVLILQKTEELTLRDTQIRNLEDCMDKLKHQFLQEIDELKGAHQKEIQVLESDMLKTVTNMHEIIEDERESNKKRVDQLEALKQIEIDRLNENYNDEKLQIIRGYKQKIQQMEENHKEAAILADIQIKEKCEAIEFSWKTKLEEAKNEADAILKECQAIAEYNIIQSEIEKNKIAYELSEEKNKVNMLQIENTKIKNDLDCTDTKRKDLEIKLSDIIIELNTVRQEYGKELNDCKESLKQVTKDKHLYELTIQKTHETIDALKRRLIKSDQDVEELKAELEATEESKLQVEGKCNFLIEELGMVTEMCDVIDEQNRLAAEKKIIETKEELLNKVDHLKARIKEECALKDEELSKLKSELKEARKFLHDQQFLNSEAQKWIEISQRELERLETGEKGDGNQDKTSDLLHENKKLKTVIEFMQASESDLLKQINQLKQNNQHENTAKELADFRLVHSELNEKYKNLQEKLKLIEEENSQLQSTVADQEALIGPFRDHLQAYETEYSALMSEKRDAQNEAKQMGLKYAEILGNQNQKQKIKHLMDLKKKNIELVEDKQKLELKIRSQARTIEKLKLETTPKKFLKKDKENIDSLNTSANSSRIESPCPVKDRNRTDSPGPLKARN